MQLDFLQRVFVPSQKKFISSRLTNYDFVPLIFVVMCCDKINLLTSCFLTVAVFVEKILRVQPKVKKLYLLLRAVDTKSAEERLHNEVKSSSPFFVFFFYLKFIICASWTET